MLHLDAATAATFANATRLSASEVAELCLDRLSGRYPPLDLDYQVIAVRHRQASGIPGMARWVFIRSTRYCPQCLAGDGSSIQRAHGGAWQQLWRLPLVFVCTTHQRLLAHECPSCCQPVHSHRGNTALQQERRRLDSLIHSAPPLDAGACGSVLALADQLLAVHDPLAARERLQPLLAQAITRWTARHLLNAEAHCSDGLRAVIAPELRSVSRIGPTGRRPGGYRPPSRRCRFGPQHIPQYLPDDWFDRHFHDLAGINPRLVRRFAPIRLVQMTAGGSQDTAAALLGVPPGRHQRASLIVKRWTEEATNARRFSAAMEALARELDDAGNLVDYRHRRETLQGWSIPQADWRKLVAELSRRESPRDRARIEWGDNKRRVASVLVWMRVTQGEHLFAPLVLAASLTPVGRNILSRSVQQACHHISTGQAGPHYVDLADALDAHADLLAAHIDSRHIPPCSLIEGP
jgi:hypothetical protein